MILFELVLGAGALLGGGYAVGKYRGKNVVLAAAASEVNKLEASLVLEERKLAADVKGFFAKVVAKL